MLLMSWARQLEVVTSVKSRICQETERSTLSTTKMHAVSTEPHRFKAEAAEHPDQNQKTRLAGFDLWANSWV